jgi:hypothetical protein
MEPKVRIELDELETLTEELERPLAPDADEARPSHGSWADGFRASGSKHAIM